MGWRSQHHWDEEEEARWRQLPLRERYNWPVVFTSIGSAIFLIVFLIWSRWS